MRTFPRPGVAVRYLAIPLTMLAAGTPSGSAQERQSKADWIRPPALKPGDTIAIVAPAGPAELPPLREYAARLEKEGYRVIIPDGIGHRRSGYLAGTDEERAAELNRMIRDPAVRAIFPTRGGFGLTRILDRIDYAALRKDPKIITGYSDLTALHLAVAREARVITFHSPMPESSLWQIRQARIRLRRRLVPAHDLREQLQEGGIGLHHRGPGRCEAGETRRRDRTRPVARREPEPHRRDHRHPVRLAAPWGNPLHRGRPRGPLPRRSHALPAPPGGRPRRGRRRGRRQLLAATIPRMRRSSIAC